MPLRAKQPGIAPVARWWQRQSVGSPGLRLRSDFVRPNPSIPAFHPQGAKRTGVKDLLRHRGIACHLFISALYLEQLGHPPTARGWAARPISALRHDWRDELARGELRNPSWASLAMGFEERPRDPVRSKKWHTTRYRAVATGFRRLEEAELCDATDRVLFSDDRRWRWNPRVVEKAYRSVDLRSEQSFVVPSSVFTTGLYLELSGTGLHTLLVALQHRAAGRANKPFHLQGLTWKTFDMGHAEILASTNDTAILEPLHDLRLERCVQEILSLRRQLTGPTPPSAARVAAMAEAFGLTCDQVIGAIGPVRSST